MNETQNSQWDKAKQSREEEEEETRRRLRNI